MHTCVRACVRACVLACEGACVRAWERASGRVCVRTFVRPCVCACVRAPSRPAGVALACVAVTNDPAIGPQATHRRQQQSASRYHFLIYGGDSNKSTAI